jgi:hypothetical protein
MDVWADPNGTLFTTAAAEKLAGGNGTLASPEYQRSGFKVLPHLVSTVMSDTLL